MAAVLTNDRWFTSRAFYCCSAGSSYECSQTNPPQAPKDDHRGGWRSMPYILLNELAERLASVGLTLNFISYLMGAYHMNQVTAASIISIVAGTASLTPLAGAVLSDAYLGRFWTIVLGSVCNLIASLLLTATAACRSLRPAAPHRHASQGQLAFLMLALVFTTLASGGLRPCTYAFGADQFQRGSPNDKKQTQSFFNWYFFFLYSASLMGATVLVYLQDNAGWVWGFSVPCVSVVFAVVLLLVGSPRFRHVPPCGSPFTAFAKVMVAAFHKRKRELPLDERLLYYGSHQLSKADECELPHTNRLKCLDHAAIKTESDLNSDGSVKSSYRLCTVNQVEQLKAVVALAPIWTINLLSTTVLSQHNAFNIPQARRMNRRVGSSGFIIPPASMSVFASLTLLLWMPLYDKVVVPRARKLTGQPGGIKVLQRIGIGFSVSIVALLVSGLVEAKRRRFGAQHVRLSVFWLVPQYCLYGLGDSFHAVGQLEFLYDQLPDNMRSVAGAVFWCSAGIGHYAGTVILQLVHRFTGTPGHADWLADDLNQGHLDYFFYLLTVLEIGNLLIFLVVARHYKYKGGFDDHKTTSADGKPKELRLAQHVPQHETAPPL